MTAYGDLTSAEDDDGFAVGGDQVLIFEHLQDATHGFAGAADDLANLLTGDLDLHAIRVSHGIRLVGQIQQGLSDPTGHVEEGQVADVLTGGLQTTSHLGGEAHQNFRIDLDQLTEFLVGNLGDFARALGADPSGTGRVLALFKQPQLTDEITLVQVGKDHLLALFILDQHGHRPLDDEVEGLSLFTGVDQGALGWVLVNVAMRQEPFLCRDPQSEAHSGSISSGYRRAKTKAYRS